MYQFMGNAARNLARPLAVAAGTGLFLGVLYTGLLVPRSYAKPIECATPAPEPDPICLVYIGNASGDVNGDGELNSKDALHVLQYSAGILPFNHDQTKIADVTNDGSSNSIDASLILQYVSGLATPTSRS